MKRPSPPNTKSTAARWAIYLIGAKAKRVGSVVAETESQAIHLAAAEFDVPSNLAFKLLARRERTS